MTDGCGQLSEAKKDNFRELFSGTIGALVGLRAQLPLLQGLEYALSLSPSLSLPAVSAIPTIRALRECDAFQRLRTFALKDPSLCRVLCSSEHPLTVADGSDGGVAELYVELMLLRMAALAELRASGYERGAHERRGLNELLDDLVRVFSLEIVTRDIVVPLLNVDLSKDEIAVPHCFVLRKRHEVHTCGSSVPLVDMSFRINTGHFVAAKFAPVWEEIRKRVTLVRLAAQPLAAYNHFSVEYLAPWEMPLLDSDFSVRFWARRSTNPKSPNFLIDEGHAATIGSMVEGLTKFDWNKITPWRLAADRLDDAVFKLECRSPDSILDIVIGLESILTGAGSAGESTHKVAVRAARYLCETAESRQEIYEAVKKAYKARSALAHGQAWALDSKSVTQVEGAAGILARILSRMAVEQRPELDLTQVDLS